MFVFRPDRFLGKLVGVPKVNVSSTEKTPMGNDHPRLDCMNPYPERPGKDEGKKWAVAEGVYPGS